MTEILEWLQAGSENLPTVAYWNDVREEEGKPFDLRCGEKERLLKYLGKETGLLEDFYRLQELAKVRGLSPCGRGVDLAAGVGWGTALLSRLPEVSGVVAVDFSRHRLVDLAPSVFEALGGDTTKITRAVGSFYDVRLPSESVDFCFLSQAFHHADDPQRLLAEVARLLRPGGSVLIIGEEPIPIWRIVRQWAANVVKRILPFTGHWRPSVPKLFPTFRELFPPDPILGDNYYRYEDYIGFFHRAGFQVESRHASHRKIFLLKKT